MLRAGPPTPRAGRAEVVLLDALRPATAARAPAARPRHRMGYGAQERYARWSLRSLDMWKALEGRARRDAVVPQNGRPVAARDEDPLDLSTLASLERSRAARTVVARRRSSCVAADRCGPETATGHLGIIEPESGVLMARRGVGSVVGERREGAHYATVAIDSPRIDTVPGRSHEECRRDDSPVRTYCFACGPWLPTRSRMRRRADIRQRGRSALLRTPAGDRRFRPRPAAWIDFRRGEYASTTSKRRGFRYRWTGMVRRSTRTPGERTAGERCPRFVRILPRSLRSASAPLVSAEVCQYENTCNGDFLIDRYPGWISLVVGGG